MKKIGIIILVVFLSGCRSSYVKQDHLIENKIPIREHSIQSVLWQQLSAEYKALCYQAFNLAKYQIEVQLLQDNPTGKSWAIITDIDETLLDNSPYNAKMIEVDEGYTKNKWIEWGELEQAKAVPGAIEFLKFVESKGIQIFYISNRYELQSKETMDNLVKLGFPSVDKEHLLLRTTTSGKEERRGSVSKENTVIMLIGDNLSDFTDLFENKTTSQRNKTVEALKDKFGKEFIVLPNPMYGDWETKGLYEGKYDWSPAQKDSIRRAKLIGY